MSVRQMEGDRVAAVPARGWARATPTPGGQASGGRKGWQGQARAVVFGPAALLRRSAARASESSPSASLPTAWCRQACICRLDSRKEGGGAGMGASQARAAHRNWGPTAGRGAGQGRVGEAGESVAAAGREGGTYHRRGERRPEEEGALTFLQRQVWGRERFCVLVILLATKRRQLTSLPPPQTPSPHPPRPLPAPPKGAPPHTTDPPPTPLHTPCPSPAPPCWPRWWRPRSPPPRTPRSARARPPATAPP